MKILVTGGAGFIGSHIVDAYINAGHQVAVLDNFYHGFKCNLNPKARLFKVDICNGAAVLKVFQQFRPAVVNHHAALSEVVTSMRAPTNTMATNVMGTMNILHAASQVGIKQLIFSSTGGTIYGNATKLPTPETAPLAPVSMYALSKQLGENLIQYYARVSGFTYTIFRYGNVFGIRQDPHGEAGVIAIFSELLHHQKPVTIFGDGKKTRDYIYIADVVRANVMALRHTANLLCNLGWGKQISDQTVYTTVAKHFPKAIRPKFKAVRAGEVRYSAIAKAKALRELGWKPTWSFSAGVADYLTAMNYVA